MFADVSLITFINRMNNQARRAALGTEIERKPTVRAVTYDFAVNGGAVSTIDLGAAIPAGAIVTQVLQDTLTGVTSGGAATVQLLAGATALTGATAIASITGTGAVALASSATAIKVSSATTLRVAIATSALTAGRVRFFVSYVISRDA